jgi:hypothetical protein
VVFRFEEAARVPRDAADFFVPLAETFEVLLRFAPAVFVADRFATFLRGAARFDALDDFPRALAPDDFDPVAMMSSSWKVFLTPAQDSRAASSPVMHHLRA